MIGRVKLIHNRRLFVLIIILIILFIAFMVYAVKLNNNKVDNLDNTKNGEVECNVDSDCVPDICCHASSCVPIGKAQDCSEIFCTLVCVEGTLDCGQGSCICVNGKCNAVFK